MARNEPIRSVVVARLGVVEKAPPASPGILARTRRSPVLMAAMTADRFQGDHDDYDIVMALHAKMGCSRDETTVGLVAVRERTAPASFKSPGVMTATSARLLVIDALTVSDVMTKWRPPASALLASTAIAFIATLHHDPSFRTFVALRVPKGDTCGEETSAFLGARDAPTFLSRAGSIIAGVPDDELHFVDSRGAAKATGLVHDILTGDVAPTRGMRHDRGWSEVMSVEFPRVMKHLATEMSGVADGSVDLGWSVPVAENDGAAFGAENVASR